MKALARAIRRARVSDTAYGSVAAIEARTGIGHQSIANLLEGKTPPHRINAGTAHALVDHFYSFGLRLEHFRTPH